MTILWGQKDKVYTITEPFLQDPRVSAVPFAHQFPVFRSRETAQLLIELSSPAD
ncbi:hypothetical protein [Paenibacillus apiarius]|uniref:hypothetical protein n=1 Tax=Paenibacillus apiarius TaxID=46240 RepID=UPI003B3BC549